MPDQSRDKRRGAPQESFDLQAGTISGAQPNHSSRPLKNWVARADFSPCCVISEYGVGFAAIFLLSDARDRRFRTLRRHYGPDLLRQNGSSHQVSHAHQIVGCASERENPIHFQCAAVPQFAQQRDGLQPAEAFFDALPLLLAEGIARLSRGAAVDGTAASSSGVLRYVRCHAQVATLAREFRGVVALVAAHGHTPPSRNVLQHAGAQRQGQGGQVELQRESADGESPWIDRAAPPDRFSTRGFGSSASRRENLPWDSPDHPADTYPFFFVLRLKTFQTGPGFQQCPVHGEVLVRSPAPLPCLLDHPHLKFLGYFGLQQAVTVLREGGRVPYWIVQIQSHKPAEQNVVVDLLHQHPLAAHRIQHLQQQRAQQLLRRNRWASHFRVHLVEPRRKLLENLVDPGANRPQRMILAHSLLRRNVAEHATLLGIVSSHAQLDALHARSATLFPSVSATC